MLLKEEVGKTISHLPLNVLPMSSPLSYKYLQGHHVV